MDPPTMRTIMNGGGGGGARAGAGGCPDIPKYCELRQTTDGMTGRKSPEGKQIREKGGGQVTCDLWDWSETRLGLGLGLAEAMAPQWTNHWGY